MNSLHRLLINLSLIFKLTPFLRLCFAGAHRCRHDEHQPGGWRSRRRRRVGGWFCRRRRRRRRRRSVRARRRERPLGCARLPESRRSRFTLHEQSFRPGTVLHGHVIKTKTPDWTGCSGLSVCLKVRK